MPSSKYRRRYELPLDLAKQLDELASRRGWTRTHTITRAAATLLDAEAHADAAKEETFLQRLQHQRLPETPQESSNDTATNTTRL